MGRKHPPRVPRSLDVESQIAAPANVVGLHLSNQLGYAGAKKHIQMILHSLKTHGNPAKKIRKKPNKFEKIQPNPA
jgi:hypothetical protein